MLYFSQLKQKKVFTEEGRLVGILDDLYFLASETPLITKLSVKQTNNIFLTISNDSLKKITEVITISKEFKNIDKSENELSIVRNLLDKQIIDVEGHKVIRVNDITIEGKGAEKPLYYVSGVDIGLRGILRRLGLEDIFRPLYKLFHVESHPHFLSWADIQPLELSRGKVQLKNVSEKMGKMHPEDLADYLEKTTIKNVRRILNSLDERYAIEVINDLNTSYQAALFRKFSAEKSARLIELIDPDEAVDILLTLTKDKRNGILSNLTPDKRKQLQDLIKLARTPIGGLISTDYLAISSKVLVKQAIEIIKQDRGLHSILPYIYIINDAFQLVGVVKAVDLLVNTPDTPLLHLMKQNVIVVHLSTPQEIVFKRMIRYKLSLLPVTDNDRHMLGVVKFYDVAEAALQQYLS